MAFTDLLPVPLIIAVVYAVRLSRRLGRAWKGIGIAFGGYGVGYLDCLPRRLLAERIRLADARDLARPIDPMWKSTSTTRVWACGVVGTMLFFWGVPTGVAWLYVAEASRRYLRPAPPFRDGASGRRARSAGSPATSLHLRWAVEVGRTATGSAAVRGQELLAMGTGGGRDVTHPVATHHGPGSLDAGAPLIDAIDHLSPWLGRRVCPKSSPTHPILKPRI
jgi:hypothetical protein